MLTFLVIAATGLFGGASDSASADAIGASTTVPLVLGLNLESSAAASYSLTTAKGTFTLTGYDSALTRGALVTGTKQTYALTGNAATLTWAATPNAGAEINTSFPLVLGMNLANGGPGPSNYVLNPTTGTFALSGQAVSMLWVGVGAQVGTTVPLCLGLNLGSIPGQFSLTGQTASFECRFAPSTSDYELTATLARFTTTANAATLSSNAVNRPVTPPGGGGGHIHKPPKPKSRAQRIKEAQEREDDPKPKPKNVKKGKTEEEEEMEFILRLVKDLL